MISVNAFLNRKNEHTVYWGTSGQHITDNYKMDDLDIAGLLDSGILLYSDDVREKISYPTYAQMPIWRNPLQKKSQSPHFIA